MQTNNTAVRIDKLRLKEADFKVVEHGQRMEVAERCEVILVHNGLRR